MKFSRWLCKFGFHDWKRTGNRTRFCQDCYLPQILMFYSNRTHEWEDDVPTRKD